MYRRLDVLLPEDHYSAGKKKLRTPFGTILAIVVVFAVLRARNIIVTIGSGTRKLLQSYLW